jgi:hypothetical protein
MKHKRDRQLEKEMKQKLLDQIKKNLPSTLDPTAVMQLIEEKETKRHDKS